MEIDEQILNLIIGAVTICVYLGVAIAAFIAWLRKALRQIEPVAQDGDEPGMQGCIELSEIGG